MSIIDMIPLDGPHFAPSGDIEEMQAVVLAAAIRGDEACREELPELARGFEEPYRTVAGVLINRMEGGDYIDRNTVLAALAGKRLFRRDPNGRSRELTPQEAIDLVCAGEARPGQADAYRQVLHDRLEDKRRAEFRERAQEAAREFGHDPDLFLRAAEGLAAGGRRRSGCEYPSESLKFIPYFEGLMRLQTGTKFLGLDSGFSNLNAICNGMDTGLTVIAAPPSMGKTTFLWQLCQQAAGLNKVPVVFVSMEQSEKELRAKALSRLSGINGRDLARGRLRSDDPQDIDRLAEAAREYMSVGRFLTLIEGDDRTSIDRIGDVVTAKMAGVGAPRCLVAIDYLQLLPLSQSDTGRITSPKDRIDLHVSALRRMARRLDSPVIAISAENRAGYRSRRLDVFKESGGIEYSSDIAAIMTRDKEATRSAAGNHRVVDFNIVKNRNGERGVVKFKFFPERSEFIESGRSVLPEDEED